MNKTSKTREEEDAMDRMLEQLKREAEEERRRTYLERYGELDTYEEDSDLLDFN